VIGDITAVWEISMSWVLWEGREKVDGFVAKKASECLGSMHVLNGKRSLKGV
jgi:hypothetical protein